MQVYLPALPLKGDDVMEGLRAYVGPKWDSHYRYAFGQLLYAERKGLGPGWTWNWSAALTPYLGWFAYRKLDDAAAMFLLTEIAAGLLWGLLVSGSAFAGLVYTILVIGFCVARGFLGDRLLYAQAREAVGDGVSVSREELARRGGSVRWVLWTGMSITALAGLMLVALALFLAFEDSINTWRADRAERTAARADGWVWFQSRMGDFKVAFPHDPTYSTSAGAKENRYTVQYRNGAVLQVAFEDDGGAWLGAEDFRHPEGVPLPDVPVEPTPTRLGKTTGLAATYETGEGADAVVVHHRVYRTFTEGGRLYQVVAIMKKSDPAAEDVERFFSSFQIITNE
jgi:hypothetical protein